VIRTASMRNAFGEALLELGDVHRSIVVLDADLSKATKTDRFAEAYPDRFFNMGIGEQNMITVAAGLATCGKIPFATTLAVFAALRACEQVRTSVALSNVNAKIVGCYGGLCTAENGPTHQCIADVGTMRTLPNMTVLAPSDAVSCKACVRWAAEHHGPVYLRVLRDAEPVLYESPKDIDVVSGNRLHEGDDIAILSNGYMSHMALEAARELKKQGISAAVHDVFCLKPLASEVVLDLAHKCKGILTIEEHNIYGGLGSGVAEIISQAHPARLKIIGINDCFSGSGTHKDLLEKAGLTVENIIQQVAKCCRERRNDA